MSPRISTSQIAVFIVAVLTALPTIAAQVDFVPVWGNGNNQNFNQAELAINDNDARIADMESQIAAMGTQIEALLAVNAQLQQQIADLESASDGVAGLNEYVSVGPDQFGRPAVFFDSVNVYIRNGTDSSESESDWGQGNGLGNLIIGYNEESTSAEPYCTQGWDLTGSADLETEVDCLAASYEWTTNDKSGSHNLIMGSGHNYSGNLNIVHGHNNTVADSSNLVGGFNNYSRSHSAILGSWDSKTYFAATVLGSWDSEAYNGAVISSYNAKTGGGSGTIISSFYVENDIFEGSDGKIYLNNDIYGE